MNRSRRRLAAIAGLMLAVGTAGAASAGSSVNLPVTVSASAGTRTLTVTDLSGNPLGPTNGLALANGQVKRFVVSVTDVNYSHVGYQVTSEMSNLYPYANGSYDFAATPIPSGNVQLSNFSSLLDLENVKSLVAPVFTLTGTLPSVLGLSGSSTLTGLGGAVQSATTVPASLVGSQLQSDLSLLPLQVTQGPSGEAYTNPAQLVDGSTTGPAVSGTPTQLTLMSGSAQPGDLAGLLSELQGVYNGLSAATLIADGVLSQDTVVTALETQLGLPSSAVEANLSAILSALSGTVTALSSTTGVLGQSGSYNGISGLGITVPATTTSGTFRGIYTVILADTP
jgi:hypothetical protein